MGNGRERTRPCVAESIVWPDRRARGRRSGFVLDCGLDFEPSLCTLPLSHPTLAATFTPQSFLLPGLYFSGSPFSSNGVSLWPSVTTLASSCLEFPRHLQCAEHGA